MNKSTFFALGILILLALGFGLIRNTTPAELSTNDSPDPSVLATVSYMCKEGKTFSASYTEDSVSVALSDGRKLDLAQTISASGTRYGNAEITLVTKGDNAFIEEKEQVTYADCVAHTDSLDSEFHTFTDGSKTFSFVYTNDVIISGGGTGYTESWMNESKQLGLILAQATLSKSFMPNTNFSEAFFKVATSSDAQAIKECLTSPEGLGAKAKTAMVNGTTFTVFSYSDAGAGNLYETTSYRTIHDKQCYVVEYTIHSTNIGNYSPDQGVIEFDKMKVNKVFDDMVQSFTFI